MRAFFQSLSLASASLLVGTASAVAALLIGRIRSAAVRWLAALLFPLALSYCVYWLPVWLGADGSEYSAWALFGVGVPFLAGLVPSAVFAFIVRRHAKRHAQPCAANGGIALLLQSPRSVPVALDVLCARSPGGRVLPLTQPRPAALLLVCV